MCIGGRYVLYPTKARVPKYCVTKSPRYMMTHNSFDPSKFAQYTYYKHKINTKVEWKLYWR